MRGIQEVCFRFSTRKVKAKGPYYTLTLSIIFSSSSEITSIFFFFLGECILFYFFFFVSLCLSFCLCSRKPPFCLKNFSLNLMSFLRLSPQYNQEMPKTRTKRLTLTPTHFAANWSSHTKKLKFQHAHFTLGFWERSW